MSEVFAGIKPDDVFITSQFTTLELESVAARALRARLLNRRAHGVMMSLVAHDLEGYVVVLPVSTGLLVEAGQVAVRYAL